MPRFLYVSILHEDLEKEKYQNVSGEFRYDYMDCPTYHALIRADVRHSRCHMETTILCPGKGAQSYEKDEIRFLNSSGYRKWLEEWRATQDAMPVTLVFDTKERTVTLEHEKDPKFTFRNEYRWWRPDNEVVNLTTREFEKIKIYLHQVNLADIYIYYCDEKHDTDTHKHVGVFQERIDINPDYWKYVGWRTPCHIDTNFEDYVKNLAVGIGRWVGIRYHYDGRLIHKAYSPYTKEA